MKKFLILPAALLLSTASAAPKISAQSIIVNPTQPDLGVQVWVDKNPDGSQVPNYAINDKISVNVRPTRDAYVYLFNVGPDGSVDLVLPNKLGGDNFVKANTTKTFPAAGDNFVYSVGGPVGLNKVLALASETQLNLDQLTSFSSGQSQFATVNAKGQQQLAQALSIVVSPVSQNSWVTDTAFYNVTERQATQTGNLFVGTNVGGATVTLNGQRLGDANQTFTGLRPGSYPIRVQAPGVRDFTTTIAIRANATTNVNVEFGLPSSVVVPTPAPAPVYNSAYAFTVRSSIEGARVFIDGQEIGQVRGGVVSANVTRGGHEVVMIAPGYATYVNNVNLSGPTNITITPKR